MENTVNERIKILVYELASGNKSSFARSIGISNQSLGEIIGGRQSAPSFAALQKLFTSFPQVRMEWLMLGEGSMLQNEGAPTAPATITMDGQLHPLTAEQWEVLQKAILETTPAKVAAQVETEWLGRTYHFGNEPTPGLPYDDRFSMRTGIVGDELQEFMNTPEYFNRLRHTKIGNRILVTERAIREWFGDLPKLS
jgi:hypothetical protein